MVSAAVGKLREILSFIAYGIISIFPLPCIGGEGGVRG